MPLREMYAQNGHRKAVIGTFRVERDVRTWRSEHVVHYDRNNGMYASIISTIFNTLYSETAACVDRSQPGLFLLILNGP